ncbi:MAG TPA: TetR/AcrR family transcriptional regulator [Spongiibacteraceae bacterium]|nr:TetR/AcrR family transcriptional regulator [Spongiibacteraceae bacterium]
MSTVVKRPRGRPPQLSQDRILDSALLLLQSVPLSQLTMQRLANELGTTPTALYGYFNNQEDLFLNISERVMAGVDMAAARAEQDWRQALRLWANAIRDRILVFPHAAELVQLRPGQTPAGWFELTVPLIQALRRAGLSGYLLMDSVRCISRMVFGAIVNELTLDPYNLSLEQENASAALQHLSAESRAEIEYLMPYLGDQDNNALFAFTVDRLVDGIEALVKRAPD